MKNISDHSKGVCAVFIAAILWSSGGLLIKLISLTSMQISFFRCLIAAAVFAVIFRKRVLNVNKLTVLNAFFYATVLTLFVIATKTTTAANAIFLQSTAPIYVLIFEPIIDRTRWERINIITVSVCFLAMFLFFIGELSPGHLEGNIVALLAGVAFAAFFLGMRKNEAAYQQSAIFYGNILVALICIPFILGIGTVAVSDLWMVSFLGVFQIAAAYAVFTYGIKRILAVEASIISMLEPVLSPLWVFLGYGEVPTPYAIIGGAVIIAAISARTLIMSAKVFKNRVP